MDLLFDLDTETTPLLLKWSNALWLVRVITVGTVLSEGYDIFVLSGALPHLRIDLGLTTKTESIFVCMIYAGMVIGSPFGSYVADISGRKVALGLVYVLLVVSPLLMAFSVNFEMLISGRLLEGIAIGAGLSVVSTYLGEIAPADQRGRLVGMEELFLIVGGALGTIVCFVLSGLPGDWRFMIGFGSFLPFVLGFALLLFDVPESPRWLHMQGFHREAKAALEAYVGPLEAAKVLKEWDGPQEQAAPWSKVLMPESQEKRDNMISGIIVVTLQVAGGISVLSVYLGSLILEEVQNERIGYLCLAFFGICRALVLLGVLTFFSDRLSRRNMLLISSIAAALSSFAIARVYATNQTLCWKLTALGCFAASHACGLGPAVWPYMVEVCGTDVRSKSVSLFVLISRIVVLGIMAMLPTAFVVMGTSGVYIVFGCANILGFYLMYHYVKDFQGLTLEEAHARDSSMPCSSRT